MNDGPRTSSARSPLTPPLGRNPMKPEDAGPAGSIPLWRRQLPLLFAVAGSLMLALAASSLLRPVLFPLFWQAPFYINPFITLTLLIYVGLGLVMLSGPGDQGWPYFLGFIGIWVFVVAFEYSIVQWLEIQIGAITSASRVNPLIFTACAAAVSAAILLHMNQLARRLHNDLKDRGLDPEELQLLEHEAGQQARTLVLQLLGLAFAASLVLWVGDLIMRSWRLGLDVLGILAGLLILSLLLAYSYHVLKSGPILEGGSFPPQSMDPEVPSRSTSTRAPARRPLLDSESEEIQTNGDSARIRDRRLE